MKNILSIKESEGVKQACRRSEERGYPVVCGETVWTEDKAKSALADIRVNELKIGRHIGKRR